MNTSVKEKKERESPMYTFVQRMLMLRLTFIKESTDNNQQEEEEEDYDIVIIVLS